MFEARSLSIFGRQELPTVLVDLIWWLGRPEPSMVFLARPWQNLTREQPEPARRLALTQFHESGRLSMATPSGD
jgi:hypothetical protein